MFGIIRVVSSSVSCRSSSHSTLLLGFCTIRSFLRDSGTTPRGDKSVFEPTVFFRIRAPDPSTQHPAAAPSPPAPEHPAPEPPAPSTQKQQHPVPQHPAPRNSSTQHPAPSFFSLSNILFFLRTSFQYSGHTNFRASSMAPQSQNRAPRILWSIHRPLSHHLLPSQSVATSVFARRGCLLPILATRCEKFSRMVSDCERHVHHTTTHSDPAKVQTGHQHHCQS